MTQDGFLQRVLANREIFEFPIKMQLLMISRNSLELIGRETKHKNQYWYSPQYLKIYFWRQQRRNILRISGYILIRMGHNLQNIRMLELVPSLNCLHFYALFSKCGTAFGSQVEVIRIVLKKLTCLFLKFETNCTFLIHRLPSNPSVILYVLLLNENFAMSRCENISRSVLNHVTLR